MADPRTLGLNVANVVLGMVIVACIASVIFSIVHEIFLRVQGFHTVSKELNADMKRWFGSRHYPDVYHPKH
jgi:hypothetical protein